MILHVKTKIKEMDKRHKEKSLIKKIQGKGNREKIMERVYKKMHNENKEKDRIHKNEGRERT